MAELIDQYMIAEGKKEMLFQDEETGLFTRAIMQLEEIEITKEQWDNLKEEYKKSTPDSFVQLS